MDGDVTDPTNRHLPAAIGENTSATVLVGGAASICLHLSSTLNDTDKARGIFLGHTKIPDKQISKGCTEDAQKPLRAILDADALRMRS